MYEVYRTETRYSDGWDEKNTHYAKLQNLLKLINDDGDRVVAVTCEPSGVFVVVVEVS